MTRPVVWSEDALADIEASVSFVSESNVTYAAKLAATIRAAGEALGRYDTGRPGRVPGVREKSITEVSYILAYEVSSGADGEINILRVVHARQNWPKNRWPRKSRRR